MPTMLFFFCLGSVSTALFLHWLNHAPVAEQDAHGFHRCDVAMPCPLCWNLPQIEFRGPGLWDVCHECSEDFYCEFTVNFHSREACIGAWNASLPSLTPASQPRDQRRSLFANADGADSQREI